MTEEIKEASGDNRKGKLVHEVFENDEYRIEYRTRSSGSCAFSYKSFDKKSNTTLKLEIYVAEEVHNEDGKCKLAFIEENAEPIYLYCLRPSGARREGDTIRGPKISEADKYRNEPDIGGHREWDPKTQLYPYVKNIDDVMSIYRSLKKGDFEINMTQIYHDKDFGKRNNTTPSYTKEQGVEKVLNFMDTYIFNTDASKELFAEYMQKYPLPLKEEKAEGELQVPSKEQLKKYPSGLWGARLARQGKQLFNKLLNRSASR